MSRRKSARLAGGPRSSPRELGFDETSQGRVALVVSEAASNLIKHAGGGELIVQGRGWIRTGAGWRSWRWTAVRA